MQFCETVRDIATRGGDWNYYDEQFRYLRQGNPPKYPWEVVHWELWHREMTFRAKTPIFCNRQAQLGVQGKITNGQRGVFHVQRWTSLCGLQI